MNFLLFLLVCAAAIYALFAFLQHWPHTGITGLFPLRDRFDPDQPGNSYYIESASGPKFSCSFIEVDPSGDFLLFNQLQHGWKTVQKIAGAQPILLVFYCHGWRNNAQSGNVIEFNSFLRKLATTPHIQAAGLRVHGVYLGWRGNPYRAQVDGPADIEGAFARPIVEERFLCKWLPGLFRFFETLSYWSRKRAAAHHVAGAGIARSIFQLAYAAKRSANGPDSRVVVIGHSMGALLLERALGQATIGMFAAGMPWFSAADDQTPSPTAFNPLPFDLLLFVNSAAPAIYAKMLRDYLTAYARSQRKRFPEESKRPVIVSLTSSADWATRVVHPLGNCLARFSAGARKNCYAHLIKGAKEEEGIAQSSFYDRTPGHHPLVVSHYLVRDTAVDLPPAAAADPFLWNLTNAAQAKDPFAARMNGSAPGVVQAFRIVDHDDPNTPLKTAAWLRPIGGREPNPYESAYWVIRCDGDIISGHNDYWNDTVTAIYAALYRRVTGG